MQETGLFASSKYDSGLRMDSRFFPILTILAVAFSGAGVRAQSNYLLQAGSPTFARKVPVQLGYANLANGNLHLEVPFFIDF